MNGSLPLSQLAGSITTVVDEREGRFPNEFRADAEEIFFVINRQCELSAEPKKIAEHR